MWPSLRRERAGATADAQVLELSIEEMIGMARRVSRRLPNSKISSHLPGEWRDRKRGRGLDLDSIGPYQPGDDVRHIDWHSSARVGQPQIKRYYDEIQWTLVVMVDLRPSMYFGTGQQLMAKTASLAAAQVAFSLAPSHQSVGFAVIRNTDEIILSPRRGRVARLRHLNKIVQHHNDGLTSAFDKVAPLDVALTRLSERLKRSAELVLISDMSYPGDALEGAVTAFGRRSVRLVVIEDLLQFQRPPAGRYPLKLAGEVEPQSVHVNRLTKHADARYSNHAQEQRQHLNRLLARAGVWNVVHVNADNLSQGIF